MAYQYQWKGKIYSGEVVFDENANMVARTKSTVVKTESDDPSVNLTPDASWEVSVLPNPVKEVATLRISPVAATRLAFSLYNMQGQLVWSQQNAVQSGLQELVLPTENLKSGMYHLVMRDEASGLVKSLKIIKE